MNLCDDVIRPRIGELFTCAEHGHFVRVTTPFLYPDGDVLEVFIRPEGAQGFTLTDLGETIRWLRMQTTAPRRSPKQQQMIEDVCLTQGVEFFRGMLNVRVADAEHLPESLMRLGQAAVRVSDIWFTFRTRAIESVTDEVAEFLAERNIAFKRGEKLPGRSGRTWSVDFHTRTPNRSTLTHVLSSGSRASARGVVEHVVATWHDLSHYKVGKPGIEFVSLFDDTVDVWMEEDFRLAESLSSVGRWSRPDEFEALLKAA